MIYHASILLYVKIEIDMLREEPASYYKERVLFLYRSMLMINAFLTDK